MSTITAHTGLPHPNRWRIAIWGLALALLLLPLIAMQFTREVNWTGFDFLVVGSMLLAACGSYELLARRSGNRSYRAASAIAIGSGFLLVWVNLAVGIIGSERNPANLLYSGVLMIGLVGALIARFRAAGMVHALIATALAHAAAAPIAGLDATVVLTSLFFVTLWLASAGLFRRAASQQAQVANRMA